jgi:hypothetical protein
MEEPDAAHWRLTRRGLLGTGAALVAGGYGLYPRPVLGDIPDQFDGTSFKLAAPDPDPKYGGVLRMGIANRVPHFDLHQSGTTNNLGSMACMFDNLIRRDPRLCAQRGSGDVQKGAGDQGDEGIVLQPEHHSRNLYQYEEEAVRRPTGAARHASGT